MNGHCSTCPVESECGYEHKPCDCANQRKFRPNQPQAPTQPEAQVSYAQLSPEGADQLVARIKYLEEIERKFEAQAPTQPDVTAELRWLVQEAWEIMKSWPSPKMGNPLREEIADDYRAWRKRAKAALSGEPQAKEGLSNE